MWKSLARADSAELRLWQWRGVIHCQDGFEKPNDDRRDCGDKCRFDERLWVAAGKSGKGKR
jgi:hypothetical protein